MSFVPGFVYTIRKSLVNPTAVTNLQIKANATRPIVVLKFGVAPTTAITTNTTIGVSIGRIPTTFGTVTALAAGDTHLHHPSSPATGLSYGTSATGHTATGEPTYTDTWTYGFNVLNEYQQVYLPEDRIYVAAATGVGLKTLLAPPAGTYMYWVTFVEL